MAFHASDRATLANRGSRNLVIVRAGDRSLHPRWSRPVTDGRWDLAVSYFGTDANRYRDGGWPRFDDPGPKWLGLHALLTRERFWHDYDFVWLPDDDLAVEPEDIDGLFARVDALNLDLAQPALDWHSHYSHGITVRLPSFSVRFTNFVEIMAPCFERTFLETCLPTFSENASGWGLNYLWPRLLEPGVVRCAVLDDVPITHTRPVGGPSHARMRELGVSPRQELIELLKRHGIPLDGLQSIKAAIDHEGRFLRASEETARRTITALAERDWLAFTDYRHRLAPESLGVPQPRQGRPALSPAALAEILGSG